MSDNPTISETWDNDLSFHSKGSGEVCKFFEVGKAGLDEETVTQRKNIFGENALEEGKKDTIFKIFINQFKDVLIIILVISAFISAIIGSGEGDYTDSILIVLILIINACMGVYQEWRADKAIDALKKIIAHNTHVIRSAQEIEIPSRELVPGDIIVLEQGNRIPADARMLESFSLKVEESQLTGESIEVMKNPEIVLSKTAPLGDRVNSVFMGTHATFGRGKAVVVRTGMKTEMGKIAKNVQEIVKEPTPTQIKLAQFGKTLSVIIISLMVIMVLYSLIINLIPFDEILLIAVSLAVAAIPEGLPIVITLALALSVQRMAKKQAIVKKLPAVESLGSVTTICSDKTGTLTLNEMTVQKITYFTSDDEAPIKTIPAKDFQDSEFDKENVVRLFQAATLCNNSVLTETEKSGDPTELALLQVAKSLNFNEEKYLNHLNRIDEVPFDSERKRMSIVAQDKNLGMLVSFIKGAPDILIANINLIDRGGKSIKLTEKMKEQLFKEIEDLGAGALRVLAFGYYTLRAVSYNVFDFEQKFTLCGFMAMIDPPKKEATRAIRECYTAGIGVKMLTGDHINTAIAIASQVGISASKHEQAIDGIELDRLTPEELEARVENINVFARISPSNKLEIVQALKQKGQIVSIIGDGINDSIALKGADIGISMGSGTDVTRETADMILEDDNLATIIPAIKEGRAIYDNMAKFIKYMLSSNLAEILVIFIGIALGFPPPLIAAQILYINLVTDGVPAFALGVDPAAKDIMLRQPRKPKERLISRARLSYILIFGIWLSIITLGSFIIFYVDAFGVYGANVTQEEKLDKARTIAFCILSLAQFLNSLAIRESEESILNRNMFKNKTLFFAVLFSIAAQILLVQFDTVISQLFNINFTSIYDYFEIIGLNIMEWMWVALISLSLLAFSEILKLIKRKTRFKALC